MIEPLHRRTMTLDLEPEPSLDGFAKWLDEQYAIEQRNHVNAESDCAKHWYVARNLWHAMESLRGYQAAAVQLHQRGNRMSETNKKLHVATMQTGNQKYTTAYRVEDSYGRPLVAYSGLFGWGWCSSRDAAILHARVEASDVQTEHTKET